MSFEWLTSFQRTAEKPEDYAVKTLAAYRLGMRAGGSIVGVTVQTDADCCEVVRALPAGAVYHPDEAPQLPQAGCPLGRHCRCVYRLMMTYQEGNA
jgi:hypothetical protein